MRLIILVAFILFFIATILAYRYLISYFVGFAILGEQSEIYVKYGNVDNVQCNNCFVYNITNKNQEIAIDEGNYILILENISIYNNLGNSKNIAIEFNIYNITGNPRFVCLAYLADNCDEFDFTNLTGVKINNKLVCCYNRNYDNDTWPETYNNNLERNLDWENNYIYVIESANNYKEIYGIIWIPAILNKTKIKIETRVYAIE